MATQRLARRLLASVAFAIGAAAWPSGAVAVDPIPPEPGLRVLPGAAITAIVVDLDGDGSRELVRLTPRADNPSLVAVDAWRVTPSGLRDLGRLPVRRLAGVDEQLGGRPRADADFMLPLRVDEPGRLAAWRVDGRERGLLLAIGVRSNPRPCCLTAWELAVEAGRLSLRQLPGVAGSADYVRIADLDGDGTDELVVREPPGSEGAAGVPLTVFRWTGERFAATREVLQPALDAPLLRLGDSDGRPGQEVGMLAVEPGTPALTILHRVSLSAGSLRLERAVLPAVGQLTPLPGPNGGRLLLAVPGAGLSLLNWPAGERAMTPEASFPRSGVPLGVLGSGAQARLALLRETTLDVLDASLMPRQSVAERAAASAFRGSQLLPYVGPLPGGTAEGQDAFVFRGRLVAPLPPPSAHGLALLIERPISALPGTTPVGLVGAGSLLAVAQATGFDPGRDGGPLRDALGPQRGVAVSVGAANTLLAPEGGDGRLSVEFAGAVPQVGGGGSATIVARDPFEVAIQGPVGTRLELRIGDRVSAAEIGPAGEIELPVDPNLDPSRDGEFTLRILAASPGGHGYAGSWPVRLLRSPPPLEVQPPVLTLSFSVPLAGRTAPGARVTVDGTPVAVAADGSFSASLAAGILPRDVVVAATDAVGNRNETHLSLVAPFDYRQLPWIPIVAVLTLLAGAVLYLRAPQPAPAPAGEGDARLEEID